jgi:hypothetical protein
MTSKTLFTVLGLAALVATPALAQKPVHHSYISGPYASAATSTPVVEDGRVVGTDPDPAIRAELARDWATSQGAN